MNSGNGIKVRIFDLSKGLVEYEHIKVIRIVSKDYNLLIMEDYLPIIGEINGSVDIKNEEVELNYKNIKAFYMKLNPDGKTVAATDLLVPGIGEIIGGSQREDDFEKLSARINELGLRKEDYWWYLDLRRYGSCPHSGFGLGFERMMMYLTGMQNIRDVLPFPRTPKNCEF